MGLDAFNPVLMLAIIPPATYFRLMKYRRFGRTELNIPVFSCGGMRYQYKWQDVDPKDVPQANQENLEATIHRAVELGINHIETARGYGSSEMQLGSVLPQFPREKLIVQTKVAPKATQKEFLETFETSLRYLKLDYVDLFSLHGINNQELLDWSTGKNGCLAAARQLQKEGRVRHIGFSTHATTDIIEAAINTGEFDYVNLHWYFVNDLNWSAVQAARKQDMGVFIISPNDKGGKLYAPPPKLVDLCAPLTPMQFNSLYCLARPEVHTLSCGAARPSDFDEHIRTLDFYDQIPGVIAPMEQRLQAFDAERRVGGGRRAKVVVDPRWVRQLDPGRRDEALAERRRALVAEAGEGEGGSAVRRGPESPEPGRRALVQGRIHEGGVRA